MRRISIFTLTLLAIVACTREKAYDAAGTFESETITVSARGSGEILSLDVKEGDSVMEGQVLGVVDTMSLYLQKLQLQKQVQTGALPFRAQIFFPGSPFRVMLLLALRQERFIKKEKMMLRIL